MLFIQRVFMLIYCIVNICIYMHHGILSKNPNIDNSFLFLASPTPQYIAYPQYVLSISGLPMKPTLFMLHIIIEE